jgi:hypothetical protein
MVRPTAVEPVDVLIAPYLILPNDLNIGAWSYVRVGEVESSGVLPEELRSAVVDLVEAYRVESASGPIGAIVYPREGRIGSPFHRSEMVRLRKAQLVGAISNNPRMAISDDDQEANAGHMAMTTENALLYGHPVDGHRSYVVETGSLVRGLSLRSAKEGEALPKVAAPTDLHTPLMASFDVEAAEATLGILGGNDVVSRRLDRALDWYELCFSNSVSVSQDARIVALRCAFEVLLGVGDETKKVVRATEALLRDETTEPLTYEPRWAKGQVPGTIDGLWMSRFSELRNKIAHGDEVPAELWQFEGFDQISLGHDRLLDAVKSFISNAVGDPLLRMPLGERGLLRAYIQARRDIQSDDVES